MVNGFEPKKIESFWVLIFRKISMENMSKISRMISVRWEHFVWNCNCTLTKLYKNNAQIDMCI